VRYLIAILVLAAIVAAALPIDDRRTAPAESRRATPAEPSTTPTPTTTPAPSRRDVRTAHCQEGVPSCRAVRGTVVYVESVDPDGDGDLHVVLDAGSVTLPGMTAVDVAPELRPRHDPRVGDRVSAAGPVQTGSYGQSQIHALEFRVRRG
jgi:hypothetical protein